MTMIIDDRHLFREGIQLPGDLIGQQIVFRYKSHNPPSRRNDLSSVYEISSQDHEKCGIRDHQKDRQDDGRTRIEQDVRKAVGMQFLDSDAFISP